jgi:uncharacterized membrane protein YedE/YeeE
VTPLAKARAWLAFGAGLLFAVGLGVSGMTHPSKVLGFLDVAGAWDPSLLLVMGGALSVNLLLFPRILRRARPVLDERFHVPQKRTIDARLLGGAAIFGVGWGLAGYCPGPALVSLATGAAPALVFALAMVAGMLLYTRTVGRAR